MQRRTAVKQLLAITTGALLVPACSKPAGNASIPLKRLALDSELESLLAAVTETIIPATDSPGAKGLNLTQFVMKMVDDCIPEEDRKDFEKGLASLDGYARKITGDDFIELSAGDREKVLLALEKEINEKKDNGAADPLHTFYKLSKSLTIRGYLNSEYVMTNLTYYKMVPGRFEGCVEVKNPTDYKTIFG